MNASDPRVPLASTASSHMERLFPTLTSAQMARIEARGRRRPIARGEVVVEVGDNNVPFFVVVSGEVEALRPTGAAEILIVAHGPGHFSGEANMITGRRAMGRLRASEPGEVIQLEREQLLALIQTDAELSEILMRAFMLRRLELIAYEFGDVVVVGSTHCAGTLRVKEFLMTGAVPNTGWLARCLALDDKGFIKTGPDLSQNDLALAGWPLTRPPYLLETSRPGVFAVGDVRGGNIKRVASAVGEGSIAVAFVYQVLQQ